MYSSKKRTFTSQSACVCMVRPPSVAHGTRQGVGSREYRARACGATVVIVIVKWSRTAVHNAKYAGKYMCYDYTKEMVRLYSYHARPLQLQVCSVLLGQRYKPLSRTLRGTHQHAD